MLTLPESKRKVHRHLHHMDPGGTLIIMHRCDIFYTNPGCMVFCFSSNKYHRSIMLDVYLWEIEVVARVCHSHPQEKKTKNKEK